MELEVADAAKEESVDALFLDYFGGWTFTIACFLFDAIGRFNLLVKFYRGRIFWDECRIPEPQKLNGIVANRFDIFFADSDLFLEFIFDRIIADLSDIFKFLIYQIN